MATLTVYPDAGTGATTCDSQVRRTAVNVTWADIRDGAGTGAFPTQTSGVGYGIYADTVSFRQLTRSIYTYDTSPLTASASISDATMSIFGSSKSDALSITPDMNVYAATPAANNNIVAADYSQIGTTALSSAIAYASLSTTAYNDFLLNATGISNISLTGVSRFGARNANYDVANSPPVLVASQFSELNVVYSDTTGTTSDPKLVINYTTSSAVTFINNSFFTLLGVGT